jgi:UPF0176 protein
MNKVAAFYQFRSLPDPGGLRAALLPLCERFGLRGTVLLAPEGINGTLAGAAQDIDRFVDLLRRGGQGIPACNGLEVKYSHAGEAHFDRLKIRVKREIITFGRPEADPARRTGAYVDARDWNAMLDDPDVTVIDTRNGFEVEMGSFAGAIDPGLTSFSQFPDFVQRHLDPAEHRKIAMFCTGGIRCEKASAYMLAAGFAAVFQLQGGILKYLEEVPAAASKWQGGCFVFDRRVALGHGLALAGPLQIEEESRLHANDAVNRRNDRLKLLDSARQNVAE